MSINFSLFIVNKYVFDSPEFKLSLLDLMQSTSDKSLKRVKSQKPLRNSRANYGW